MQYLAEIKLAHYHCTTDSVCGGGNLNTCFHAHVNGASGSTVEPLIKATPDVRPPLYKGHFTESQMHSFSTNKPLR